MRLLARRLTLTNGDYLSSCIAFSCFARSGHVAAPRADSVRFSWDSRVFSSLDTRSVRLGTDRVPRSSKRVRVRRRATIFKRSNKNTGAISFDRCPRVDDSLVQRRCSPSWLPGLVGFVDELWHQSQRERGAGLSCVLPSRRDGFVLPVVLLHHYLLEHTGHLTLYVVAAERGRAVFRDEELKTSCCKTRALSFNSEAALIYPSFISTNSRHFQGLWSDGEHTLGTFEIRLFQIRCFEQLVDKRIRVRPGDFDSAEDRITSAVLRFFPAFQCGLGSVQGPSFAETRTAGRISAGRIYKLSSLSSCTSRHCIAYVEPSTGIESKNQRYYY